MIRTLRGYRKNPIDPAAASEMLAYVQREGGSLLVEFETAGGSKQRILARPVLASKEKEGRRFLTVEDVRAPSGQPLEKLVGKQFDLDLSRVRTLGYVGGEETQEEITEPKFQYRFLSLDYKKGFTHAGKEYRSLKEALSEAATSPEAIRAGDADPGEEPKPFMTRPGWFVPGVKPPQPSETTLRTVLEMVNDRFADPILRRMLVATGDRRFAIPADKGGSFAGVDINDIFTRVRRVAIDSGVQPTGNLLARAAFADLPVGAKFGSAEEKEFLAESKAAYEEARQLFERKLESRGELNFGFINVDTRDIRIDAPQPFQALIYVTTMERDRVADILQRRGMPFAVKIVDEPTDPLNVTSDAERLAQWILQHPEWDTIAVAHGIPQPTTPTFIAALKAAITEPATLDLARSRLAGRAYDNDGNLILPIGGVLVDVSPRASDYTITLQSPTNNIPIFDQNAGLLLSAAQLSMTVNANVELQFAKVDSVVTSMLNLTGYADVRPIRPDVQVPPTPTPRVPEGDDEELQHIIDSILEPPTFFGDFKSVPKTPTPDAEPAAEAAARAPIPETPLTERMASSPYKYVFDRVMASMKDIKSNAATILTSALAAKQINAKLHGEDLNILERTKLYVTGLRTAWSVLTQTIEKVQALVRLLIQVRKILNEVVNEQPSRAQAARAAIIGCTSIIDDLAMPSRPAPAAEQIKGQPVRMMAGLLNKVAVTDMLERLKDTLQNRLNRSLLAESDIEILRGLKQFAPTLTPEGYYDLVGDERKLVVREVLTVPKERKPVRYTLGQRYEVGDIIELQGSTLEGAPRSDVAGTGFLILRQEHPLNVAPIRADYIGWDKRLMSRSAIAAEYEGLAMLFRKFMAEAWRVQWELSEKQKIELVEDVSEELDAAKDKDPSVVNYVAEAETRRIEKREALFKQYTADKDEFTVEEQAAIKKKIDKETRYDGANAVNEPVLYVLVVDEKTGSVYYPQDMNLLAWAEAVVGFNPKHDFETLNKIERSPKFMSQFPLDTGVVQFMRKATNDEAEAVMKILLPLGRRHANTPLRWSPARYRQSAEMRSDVKDIRESVDAIRHINARLAAGRQRSERAPGRGAVTVRRGGETPGRGLEGTLGVGAVTGAGTLAGGSKYRVTMRGAKPGETVGGFYLKSDPGRLRRYLQQLARGMEQGAGLSRVKPMALLGKKNEILSPYRHTDAYGTPITWKEAREEFLRAYPDMQALLEQLQALEPAVLDKLREEGGEFVDSRGMTVDVTAEEVQAAEKAEQDMNDLQAIETELARRQAAAIERDWQRIEKRSDPTTRFFLKYRRLPTEQEAAKMWEAALKGVDPLTLDFETKSNPMKRPLRNTRLFRNAGPDDINEPDEDDFGAGEGETVAGKVGAAPPPPPPPPPPSGATSGGPKPSAGPSGPPPEGARPTGDAAAEAAAASRALEAAKQRQEAIQGARSPFGRTQDVSEVRVEQLRASTQAAWINFNDALNNSKTDAAALTPLLDVYLSQAESLQEALQVRDTNYLKKNGPEALRELLRNEALAALAKAQAAYTRAPRGVDEGPGSKKASARARLAAAKYAAESIDPYGRPIAPPSPERLAQRGLRPLDLATAQASKLRETPAAMNYAQLIEAARLAARAEKAKQHGVSIGTISCRVMGDEGGVRNKLDRELIVRLFDSHTYRGGGRRGGIAQPNSGNVNWDQTMFVWLSPDSDHAIVFARNVGVCEFHSASYSELLASVFRYIADWFSDPRNAAERNGYSVFLGRSGHDRIYQIWGQWPASETTAATVRDGRRPTPLELLERAAEFGVFDLENPDELIPLGRAEVPKRLKNLTFYWVTNTSAQSAGFENLAAYLTAESEAYRRALGATRFGRPASESYEVLRSAGIGERAAHVEALMQDVNAAMVGTRKAVTLYYPELYNASGQNLSANEGTPEALFKHLRAVADAVPDGGVVRVIDMSLFRKSTRLPIMSEPKVEPVSSAKSDVRGIVPTPYATLWKLMQGKPAAVIEVLLPEDPEVRAAASDLFPVSSTHPLARPVFVPRVAGLAALGAKGVIAAGSTVILWNDPDLEGEERQFGQRDGLRLAATAIAQYIGFVKRVYIESAVRTMAATLAPDAEMARKDIEVALAQISPMSARLIRDVRLNNIPVQKVAEDLGIPKRRAERLIQDALFELREALLKSGMKAPETTVEVPFVTPESFRKELVEALAAQVKAAGTDPLLLGAALGVPGDVAKKVAKRAKITDPKATAEEVVNEVARAYQVDPAEYVLRGGRGSPVGSSSILLNRGLARNTNRRTKIYGTKVHH